VNAGRARAILRAVRRRRLRLLPVLATAVIAAYALIALLAPLLAPHGETEVVGSAYEPAGMTFLLGTDNLGRDMVSRLVYGARNSIFMAVLATALSFVGGTTVGFAAAVAGGWLDQVLARGVDVLIAIPRLIFALLILSVVGTSATALVLTIAMLDATRVFRIARAVAGGIVMLDFVELARARGEGVWWIMRREILPNATAPLLAELGLRFGYVFLFISTLGFLGIGIQPPSADWGSMVRENATLIPFGMLVPIVPAFAIALLSLAVNFLVDSGIADSIRLRD
jgi:peptide/nickel transport system permease protein